MPTSTPTNDNSRVVTDRALDWPFCEAAGCEKKARWLVEDPSVPWGPWNYCGLHVMAVPPAAPF